MAEVCVGIGKPEVWLEHAASSCVSIVSGVLVSGIDCDSVLYVSEALDPVGVRCLKNVSDANGVCLTA